MTLQQLKEQNERFQKSAVQLSELIPSSGLANATSMIIRSAQKLNVLMEKLLRAPSEVAFNQVMDRLEEEIDEIIFVLDQLGNANKKQQIKLINDFLKQGYDLLSVYSKCLDSIIDRYVEKEN